MHPMARTLWSAVALLPLAAHCDVYGNAIGKAFPGFRILAASEISLAREEMKPEAFDRRMANPGIVTGHFNADGIEDFAAIIRSEDRKFFADEPPDRQRMYAGHLVVCFGRGQKTYDCKRIDAGAMRIEIPHHWYLDRVAAGTVRCLALKSFRIPRAGYDQVDEVARAELPFKPLPFSVDALGYFRTRGRGDVLYVARTENTFAECTVSD
jgi:hypothetical protein